MNLNIYKHKVIKKLRALITYIPTIKLRIRLKLIKIFLFLNFLHSTGELLK